jgi:hypothetical protein
LEQFACANATGYFSLDSTKAVDKLPPLHELKADFLLIRVEHNLKTGIRPAGARPSSKKAGNYISEENAFPLINKPLMMLNSTQFVPAGCLDFVKNLEEIIFDDGL